MYLICSYIDHLPDFSPGMYPPTFLPLELPQEPSPMGERLMNSSRCIPPFLNYIIQIHNISLISTEHPEFLSLSRESGRNQTRKPMRVAIPTLHQKHSSLSIDFHTTPFVCDFFTGTASYYNKRSNFRLFNYQIHKEATNRPAYLRQKIASYSFLPKVEFPIAACILFPKTAYFCVSRR